MEQPEEQPDQHANSEPGGNGNGAAVALSLSSRNGHSDSVELKVRVGVLTVSDRCSRGESEDLSGPAIQHALGTEIFVVSVYACIPDDRKTISRTLRRWADDDLCDCILTTGGTGLAERDVTPEATERVLDQHLPALAMHIALEGAKIIPTALLSRGVAGARGNTLIVNLPGSPGGAGDGASILTKIIPHAVEVLQERVTTHPVPSGVNNADV